MTTTLPAPTATDTCALDIGGMTCASCVGRVEKALTRSTAWSTPRSTSRPRPPSVDLRPGDGRRREQLTAAVEKAGYTGTLAPAARRRARRGSPDPIDDDWTTRRDAEIAELKRQWQVAWRPGCADGADVPAAARSTPWTG